MNFIHLSHDGVTLGVDRDLSTATLLIFISLLSPDEDLQCCSRNVAINIQSDSKENEYSSSAILHHDEQKPHILIHSLK